MTIRVKFTIGERTVDEVVVAPDSDTMLAMAKERVAAELGWKGLFLSVMTPLQFAQLAVSKYNENFGTSYEIPSCGDDFIRFGLATGNVEILSS